ncbi:hypothetical protein EI42_01236 [Thermosporothrix hazakensis]|uniref:Uncharacterized protein n=1 Tax=Thermosporothrix hazakensis TaxID=644383 RepID=A0A326UCQ4_THEHA|nr:hypothetical protein EI42_01236 [Thermosporothrix hazakensis]
MVRAFARNLLLLPLSAENRADALQFYDKGADLRVIEIRSCTCTKRCTYVLARELGARGITVNAVLPGLVETEGPPEELRPHRSDEWRSHKISHILLRIWQASSLAGLPDRRFVPLVA